MEVRNVFHSIESDCPCCGHMRAYHAYGRCTLTGYATKDYSVEYPGGCGCVALMPNQTCEACGRLFVPSNIKLAPEAKCPDCRQAAWQERTRAAFAPLVDALAARGIQTGEPWNMGGGMMGLSIMLDEVTIPFKDRTVTTKPDLRFSEADEMTGCCLYLGEDEWVCFSPPVDAPYRVAPDEHRAAQGWATKRNGRTLGEATAEWVASILPDLQAWVTREVRWTAEPYSSWMTGIPDHTIKSAWDQDPALDDTVISDIQKQPAFKPEATSNIE